MQKNPALCKADYLQSDLSMVAKQEVDFELLAAVEASEAEGKMTARLLTTLPMKQC